MDLVGWYFHSLYCFHPCTLGSFRLDWYSGRPAVLIHCGQYIQSADCFTLYCQEQIIYLPFLKAFLFPLIYGSLRCLLFRISLSRSSLLGMTWKKAITLSCDSICKIRSAEDTPVYTVVWMDHSPRLCLPVQVWHIARGFKSFLYPMSTIGMMHHYHRLQFL